MNSRRNPSESHLNREEALEKIRNYCVYRERSHREVRSKLLEMEFRGEDLENIITTLIQEDFLNEERFARAYVRGKHRQNKWGRQKIRQGLHYHQITERLAERAMTELDENYQQALEQLYQKKRRELGAKFTFEENGKIAQHLIRKGYEPDLVWERINSDKPGP